MASGEKVQQMRWRRLSGYLCFLAFHRQQRYLALNVSGLKHISGPKERWTGKKNHGSQESAGMRSYEALRQLQAQGFDNAVGLQGGIAALKKAGMLDLD